MATNPTAQFDQDTLQKIKLAQQQGHDPSEVMRKAVQYQASKAQTIPQPTSQAQPQQAQPKSNFLVDLLPLIGAVGGSFIPGAGTILGGAAGAGLGTLLKQGIQEKPLDVKEVAKEAAFAGVGGVAGKAAGFVGSKLFPSLAEGLGSAGEKLAAKAFRITPSQATRFTEETGEGFGKFISSRGIGGVDDLVKRTEALQGHFDDVVLRKDFRIDPNSILQEFSDRISALSESTIPAQKAKAEALEVIANNFVNKYGSKPLSAQTLTAVRKEVDSVIRDFPLEESVKGPLNLYRDVLQESLRKKANNEGISIAGKNLKEVGVELSKSYKALEIANRQGNIGVGTMPAGITTILAGLGGFGAGGPGGAAAAIAGKEAINSPAFLGMLSKFATKAGGAAEQIPGMPAQMVGQLPRAGMTAGALAGIPGQAEGASVPMDEQSMLPQPPSMAMADQSMTGGGGEQDQLRQVLAAIMFEKAKSVSDIKTAYEFLSPSAPKPLAAEQQKMQTNAESGLRAIAKVEGILSGDPNAPLKSKIPIVKGRSPYAAAAKEVQDVYTRLRTGAALNDQEQKFYDSQLPQVFDSPETISYKLSLFRDLFSKFAYGQTPASPDINIPAPTGY